MWNKHNNLTDCEGKNVKSQWPDVSPVIRFWSQGNTHVLTGKFDLTNVNNMAFSISGPKLLFETTEISTRQESNYIYLYTTKFRISIKIWLNRKFESTEFETKRVNCIHIHTEKVINIYTYSYRESYLHLCIFIHIINLI